MKHVWAMDESEVQMKIWAVWQGTYKRRDAGIIRFEVTSVGDEPRNSGEALNECAAVVRGSMLHYRGGQIRRRTRRREYKLRTVHCFPVLASGRRRSRGLFSHLQRMLAVTQKSSVGIRAPYP